MKKTLPRPCSCGNPREKEWHLACPTCWALIPSEKQEEVYRLYKTKPRSNEHLGVIVECYGIISRARQKQGGVK